MRVMAVRVVAVKVMTVRHEATSTARPNLNVTRYTIVFIINLRGSQPEGQYQLTILKKH